jgi:hypothetical protein
VHVLAVVHRDLVCARRQHREVRSARVLPPPRVWVAAVLALSAPLRLNIS